MKQTVRGRKNLEEGLMIKLSMPVCWQSGSNSVVLLIVILVMDKKPEAVKYRGYHSI